MMQNEYPAEPVRLAGVAEGAGPLWELQVDPVAQRVVNPLQSHDVLPESSSYRCYLEGPAYLKGSVC